MKGVHGRARWVAVAIAVAGLVLGVRGGAQAERVKAVPPIELWIAATPHVDGATSSEVRFVRHGEALEIEQNWATIHHAPNAPIRGDVLADRESLVVAFEPDDADPRDDFASEVHRVDRQGAKRLVGGAYRATRPFVAVSGKVFIERGKAGSEPSTEAAQRGLLRIDLLTLDELDARSGAVRTLAAWSGYTMHIAGEWRDSLVIYRVGPNSADIVLIRTSDGSVVRSVPVEPYARDFVIAGDQIAFGNHNPAIAHRWVLQTIDLRSFATSTLGETTGQSPVPFVTAQGAIGMAAEPRALPRLLEGALVPLVAHARGDLPLAMSLDGAFAIVATPGELDLTEDVHVTSKRRFALTHRDERIEFIGYRAGTRGALR
jgi:hypothetical protein